MRKNNYLLPLLGILFISCSIKKIEKIEKETLYYTQLPEIIQSFFHPCNSYNQVSLICLDSNLKTNLKINCQKTPLSLLLYGFTYHISINNLIFSLKANKGDPLIIFDSNLYYTEELMLDSNNYKTVLYFKIDLNKYLKIESLNYP
jgi:hypothetical protein